MKRNQFLALAACALLGSASAEAAAAPAAGGSNQSELAFQAQPGVWVFRDASTGKTLLGPVSAAHLEAMREEISHLANRSADGLVAETHANGTKSMDLQGRFQYVMVVNRLEDGFKRYTCSQDAETILQALRVPVTRTANGLETE